MCHNCPDTLGNQDSRETLMGKTDDEKEWERQGAAMERGRVAEQEKQKAYKKIYDSLASCFTGCGCLVIIIIAIIAFGVAKKP
jgi:hypothetical protein